MKFTYEARDAANRVRKGVTEAPSLREATKLLIDQGWYVSKIKPRRRLSRGVLSFGGGFRYEKYQIDYAFVPFGDLGNTHRISLLFNF